MFIELASDRVDSLGFDLKGNSVHCRYVAGRRAKETIQQLQSAVSGGMGACRFSHDREGETILASTASAETQKAQRVVYAVLLLCAQRSASASEIIRPKPGPEFWFVSGCLG